MSITIQQAARKIRAAGKAQRANAKQLLQYMDAMDELETDDLAWESNAEMPRISPDLDDLDF